LPHQFRKARIHRREQARAAWTAIGALGLAKDYLDFKIELRP